MKKLMIITGIILSFLLQESFFQAIPHTNKNEAFAADPKDGNHATLLPTSSKDTNCEMAMKVVNGNMKAAQDALAKREVLPGGYTNNDILGCAIKTGNIRFFMIPYFVRYILEFIIYVVGFLSILGIIYGGYNYLFAGLSEDKDSGKNAIKNSLIGLVLSILAWPIVNIVLSLLS